MLPEHESGLLNPIPVNAVSSAWQAVVDKVPDMLNIMFDVITDANLDSQQRVVEMLKESKVLSINATCMLSKVCVWIDYTIV